MPTTQLQTEPLLLSLRGATATWQSRRLNDRSRRSEIAALRSQRQVNPVKVGVFAEPGGANVPLPGEPGQGRGISANRSSCAINCSGVAARGSTTRYVRPAWA